MTSLPTHTITWAYGNKARNRQLCTLTRFGLSKRYLVTSKETLGLNVLDSSQDIK